MTPRTFFTLFIKILAVYLLIGSLDQIPQVLSTVFSVTRGVSDIGVTIFILIAISFVCAVYIIILYYLVLKTDWVIDKLALDKNFPEEKIELNIHRSTVLSIAVIVIGGLIFVDALPDFCGEIFRYYQNKALLNGIYVKPYSGQILFYAIKGFIGCFMVIYNQHIVNFIEVKRKKKD